MCFDDENAEHNAECAEHMQCVFVESEPPFSLQEAEKEATSKGWVRTGGIVDTLNDGRVRFLLRDKTNAGADLAPALDDHDFDDD